MTDQVQETLNARGKNYGKFESHASITQAYKAMTEEFLKQQNKDLHPDQMEALDMIFHKIGRIVNGNPNYDDSWVDIAGYAMLVANRLQGKAI